MITLDDEIATLTGWACGLDQDDQDRLLLALANALGSERFGARSRRLFEALLPALAEGADADTRRELALRLGEAPWAPEALLAELAADQTPGVGIALARRGALPETVVAVLLETSDPDVLALLAANRAAVLTPAQLDALVEEAAGRPALRRALGRRPELTREQAARLHRRSSSGLQEELAARFDLPVERTSGDLDLDVARRTVEKLGRCGRLTPSYAVAALRRGRLTLFQQALATLGGVSADTVRSASEADDPASLALACAAVGVDRSVFPEILREVQALNAGRPPAGRGSAEVIAAFRRTPAEASSALRSGAARRSARWSVG